MPSQPWQLYEGHSEPVMEHCEWLPVSPWMPSVALTSANWLYKQKVTIVVDVYDLFRLRNRWCHQGHPSLDAFSHGWLGSGQQSWEKQHELVDKTSMPLPCVLFLTGDKLRGQIVHSKSDHCGWCVWSLQAQKQMVPPRASITWCILSWLTGEWAIELRKTTRTSWQKKHVLTL